MYPIPDKSDRGGTVKTVDDFISGMMRAKDENGLFDAFNALAIRLGFDRVLYTLITDHPSAGLKRNLNVRGTFDPDWLDHYARRRYLRTDPVVRRLFATRQPFPWSVAFDVAGNDSADVQRILIESREIGGMRDGISVPLHGPNFELAAIAVGITDPTFKIDRMSFGALLAGAVQFHTAFCLLSAASEPEPLARHGLTEREKEILLWSAEGKSVYEISVILNTSEDNIKYHLKKVYRRLDVADRMQAVLKSVTLGLINPALVQALGRLPG